MNGSGCENAEKIEEVMISAVCNVFLFFFLCVSSLNNYSNSLKYKIENKMFAETLVLLFC